MDHFENFEELIKTCKMWIRDDDIEAYYRFFEFNCMKTLVTAYEKEKNKNKKAIKYCKEKSTFQTFGDFELQNVLETYINRLKHRILDILEE